LLSLTGCATTPSAPATPYDLRIDTSFHTLPVSDRQLVIVITPAPGTPPAPVGSVINIQGSLAMSTGAPFTGWTLVGPNWTCSGSWAAFQCTKPLPAPLSNETVQLFTSYAAQPPGTTVTYIASVSMTGNIDPDPTTDSRNITHGLS
jgi:hypothetical protein